MRRYERELRLAPYRAACIKFVQNQSNLMGHSLHATPVRISACAIVVLGCAFTLACTQRDATSDARGAELSRLHAACVEAMLRSTCRVMTGPTVGPAAAVVFVAGVGPVDATAYRELRASGEAMCTVIQRACTKDPGGPQCKTAMALWPPPAEPRPAPKPGS